MSASRTVAGAQFNDSGRKAPDGNAGVRLESSPLKPASHEADFGLDRTFPSIAARFNLQGANGWRNLTGWHNRCGIHRGFSGLGGFLVGGEIATVFPAGVKRRGLVTKRPARVLPRLAFVVPMKAKLGQNSGDGGGLFLGKLNPNPFADNLRQFKKLRGFPAEQGQ
jgi:hypothetical protein